MMQGLRSMTMLSKARTHTTPPTLHSLIDASASCWRARHRSAMSDEQLDPCGPSFLLACSGSRVMCMALRAVVLQVAHFVPESAIFSRLLHYERRINDAINHRKSEIREAMFMPEHIRKRLRLYIYNTHAHTAKAGDASTSATTEPPSWTLTIHGRLVDPPGPAAAPAPIDLRSELLAAAAAEANPLALTAPQPPAAPPGPKVHMQLTQALKRLEVRLDPTAYPGASGKIVWEKSHHQVRALTAPCTLTHAAVAFHATRHDGKYPNPLHHTSLKSPLNAGPPQGLL